MEFNRALARTVGLENARRAVTVVGDFGVGAVVGEDDVVLEAKFDCVLEERKVYRRGGRIVGIVEPQHLCATRNFGGDRGEIGNESAFFSERQEIWLAAIEDASRVVNGIAGVG